MVSFFSFSGRTAFVALTLLAGAVQPGVAVCNSDQIAVGIETLQMFTGLSRSIEEYSGFLMENNCKLIAQNGVTQNSKQHCKGGYYSGASVSCSGSEPTSAVDTQGVHWNCSPTSDSSCNVGGSGGMFRVLACCSRA